MYEAFYSMIHRPFALTPDSERYFPSANSQCAAGYLTYGLSYAEGGTLLTGMAGSGKTLLARRALAELPPMVQGVYVSPAGFGGEDLLRLLAAGAGLNVSGLSRAEILLAFEAHALSMLTVGRRCLLVVDDADALPDESLLALLSVLELQLAGQALFSLFLIGGESLNPRLQQGVLLPLGQRLLVSARLGQLLPDEIGPYLNQQITLAGGSELAWPEEVLVALHQATGGNPRRLNLLADRLLLAGFLAGRRVFTVDDVSTVSHERMLEEQSNVTPMFSSGSLEARVMALEARLAALEGRL